MGTKRNSTLSAPEAARPLQGIGMAFLIGAAATMHMTIGYTAALFADEIVDPFQVLQISPQDGAKNQSCDMSIRIHFNEIFEPRTVDPQSVRLLDSKGREIESIRTTDLGGVVTISPLDPLRKDSKYQVEVTAALLDKNERPIKPFKSSFQTGNKPTHRPESKLTRFKATRLTEQQGLMGVAAGPDGAIYACSWDGKLYRYQIDVEGNLLDVEMLKEIRPGRILCLAFDPDATARSPIVWVLYDPHSRESITSQSYRTTLAKWELPAIGQNTTLKETRYLVGLPSGDHPTGSITFGGDGKAYISQGAMTMNGSGADSGSFETPLSASILVADVRNSNFGHGNLPVDVTTEQPVAYDPFAPEAPVRVFATGIREPFDLCWHSNGQLYCGVNMNDTNQPTPAHDGLLAYPGVRPNEPLLRVVEGAYYGHPNPAIDRYIMQGGNPTTEQDPWEIDCYPVGTSPEPDFDPNLLIYDLTQVGGESADGCVEYQKPGILEGRLLFCFYTSRRAIGAFKFSDDGHRVTEFDFLPDEQGRPLRFGAPLDIATDSLGRIWVADFEDRRRGDSGSTGGLWRLDPVSNNETPTSN